MENKFVAIITGLLCMAGYWFVTIGVIYFAWNCFKFVFGIQ